VKVHQHYHQHQHYNQSGCLLALAALGTVYTIAVLVRYWQITVPIIFITVAAPIIATYRDKRRRQSVSAPGSTQSESQAQHPNRH
jgi:hypothetical protein